MPSTQSIGARIREVRKALNLTQKAFADRISRSKSTIANIEGAIIDLSPSIRLSICKEFNIRDEWILTGEGEMFSKQVQQAVAKDQECEIAQEDEFVTVPRFEHKISAGPGLIPINNVEIKIAFRRDWIKKKGDPNKMSIVRVSGDSMVPTLMPDDLVLVDHGHNHIDPQGGIYAIALDDHILIKRLQVVYPAGKIKIISDNNRYESIEVPFDQVKINGKVIWFGREI